MKNPPAFLYGTAWKENETRRLVRLALESGFRGIDTANQRKHYHEVQVGEGIADAVKAGVVKRDELFIQTKFTHIDGQDSRLPYDPDAPVGKQVEQSFASSVEHLGAIDSLVLHGPSTRRGLAPEDIEAWEAMEELARAGKVKHLGASNVSAEQLELLCDRARVAPTFCQDRCYASQGWNRDTRDVCRDRKIVYQAFSVLTANRRELASAPMRELAKRNKLTVEQLVFRFALDLGWLPLTGTTSATHMKEDLAVLAHAPLAKEDLARIETISG